MVEQSVKPDTSPTDGIITHPDDSVKGENKNIPHSDRDSYAPTFYSHMGKVIDGTVIKIFFLNIFTYIISSLITSVVRILRLEEKSKMDLWKSEKS